MSDAPAEEDGGYHDDGIQEFQRVRVLFSSNSRLEGHFFWHPQADTASDETEPHHEVGFFGAVEPRHGFAQETGMDEKGGYTRDWVMLKKVKQEMPNAYEKGTYISRDAAHCASVAESLLELVGHEPPKNGVDIEGLLVYRKVVKTEPQAGRSVGRMQMYLICDTPDLRH
jgi:hypothetical protein